MSRSIAKSKLSPAISPAGSSQAASVNCPPSHVKAPGQQAVLDLGGERQPDGALPPLEQVGEPPVGDDDVRQRVRGERDVGERLLVRGLGEAQLQHADRLAAVGHRCVHARAVGAGLDLDRLIAQRAPVRAALQDHALGGLAPLPPRRGTRAGVAEPDERAPAEVHDEEGDLRRAERVGEPLPDHVRGRDRGCVLDRGEQLREVQPARSVVRHRPHPTPCAPRGGAW